MNETTSKKYEGDDLVPLLCDDEEDVLIVTRIVEQAGGKIIREDESPLHLIADWR